MRKTQLLLLTMFIVLGLASCKRDRHDPHDREVITTMTLSFVNIDDPSDAPVFNFKDPDGDGGNPPTIFDTVRLKPDATYHLMLELKDESQNPAVDLTEEIKEEGHEHQFFYSTQPHGLVTVTYADSDKDGLPIGLHTLATTSSQVTANNTSKFRIILRHNPNKSATGVNHGSITNAGGDTDIDLAFPLIIQ